MEDRESNGSSSPRGMARWSPMMEDRSCAQRPMIKKEKSRVLGESADYQGKKGHIMIIIIIIIAL